MKNLKMIARFAQTHGAGVALFAGVVLVWDKDEAIAVKTMQQVKEWLGY